MASPFIGEIRLFAGNFAPRGYAFCRGQLFAIAQNSALFSLIGTIYGGDGQTTFGLPNLQGRIPVGQGSGPGLTPRVIGQMSGTETATVTTPQMPAHTHTVACLSTAGNSTTPGGNVWAVNGNAGIQSYSATSTAQMNPAAISSAGSSQPHENMMPFLALTFIIAVEGVYPSRN